MEVTPGYKQSEVGVVPEDWDLKPLGQLSEFVTSGSRGWARHYSDRGPIFVRSQNIRDGHLDFTDRQCVIPPAGSEGSRTRLNQCDLLITMTGNSVGNVAWVKRDLGEAYISQHVGLVRLLEPLFAEYICLYLAPGAPGNWQIWASQTGQSKPGLNLTNLEDFWVAMPPLPEQRAITDALSEADALIDALEQFVTKKRQIKHGAMQELLTGKKRLPGFTGEWEVKRLGDLGVFLKGSGVTKSQMMSGELPCVRYGEIYTRHNDYITDFHSWISREVAQTAIPLKRGDILFAGSGETKEEIGKCVAFIQDVEAYAGGDIVILRTDGADPLFLGYFLNTADIARQKASRGQGDAVVHISASALAAIEGKLPRPAEQQGIASILSDMDAEIAALEAKLAKARQVKQGMMQELLTGRIRLL